MTKRASKGSTLHFKSRADVTRSPEQGYQRPDKKDESSPENVQCCDDDPNFQHREMIVKIYL